MTIENWLADKHQAGPDDVAKVAKLFDWTYDQLYAGIAPTGIMDRVAELEGFRARARRLAAEIAGDDVALVGAARGFVPVPAPKQSSGKG